MTSYNIKFSLLLLMIIVNQNLNRLYAQNCKVLEPSIAGIYTGDCKSGKADGLGKSIGQFTYEGSFKAGYPDGIGYLFDSAGNTFKGSFKKGKKDGEGVAHMTTNLGRDSILTGFWKKGVYVGLFEYPYKLINKTFMVSAATIDFDAPTPPYSTIEISMESVSGGAYNVHGEIPKPTLTEAIFQRGSYQGMMPVTNQQKRNTYIFQNVIFPAYVLFKIGAEEVQIEFNEAKNYKVFVTTRD